MTENMPKRQTVEDLLRVDAEAGPAARLSAAEERALVNQVMRRALAFDGRSRVASRPRVVWLSGVVLVAGAAAAAVAVQRRAPQLQDSPPAASQVSAPQASALELAKRLPSAVPSAHPEAPAQNSAVLLERPAPAPSTGRPASSVEAPLAPAAERVARDSLEQANALRSARRYAEALRQYLEVVNSFPRSLQAQAARVAAADLKLEHFHDPVGARRLYSDAARSGNALSEEAAFGLAASYRQQADVAKERAALTYFLKHYPGSSLVSAASKRLQALGRE